MKHPLVSKDPADSEQRRRWLIAELHADPWYLSRVPEELRREKEVVMIAVRGHGGTLRYADAELQSDPEVVLAALDKSHSSLQHAGDSLKTNKDFVMKAMGVNPLALEFLQPPMNTDIDVIVEAALHDSFAVRFIPPHLLEDREAMLKVIQKNGRALEFVDSSLREDKSFVLEAVKQVSSAMDFADTTLKKDKEFALEVVEFSGITLEYVSNALRADRDVVLRAIRQDERAVRFIAKALASDGAFLAAVDSCLAYEGQSGAPVVTLEVELVMGSTNSDSTVDSKNASATSDLKRNRPDADCTIEVVGHLLSGLSATCRVPSEATIGELARRIRLALLDLMEPNKGFEYAHIVIDGRDEPVGPFEAGKPALDYLPQCLVDGSGGE
eukprot:CAMPEP_0206429424 /NCGR_PEP_ID=MMETSP0324_2-20121206/6232_1 /ASSEMBLY_ACC=CAM_ASM_000836 /TAXON_ID=2866 /ORGANISM="Crypthecodinium cohnii, Strain Seligo" /LENGTH=383 /DNA_ID=CAMNT_0053895101 /DNA_START=327 /DNA_END=1475 /DNA_ORIENTATION=-